MVPHPTNFETLATFVTLAPRSAPDARVSSRHSNRFVHSECFLSEPNSFQGSMHPHSRYHRISLCNGDPRCVGTRHIMLRYNASSSNYSGFSELSAPAPSLPRSFSPAVPVKSFVPSIEFPSANDSAPATPSALVTKLSAFGVLGAEEVEALELLSRNAKPMQSDHILVHEGSPSDSIYLIVSGLACRYKMLAGGRRQILGYLIPGDLCDIHFAIANRPDYSVSLTGGSSVARIPTWKISELMLRYPVINRALSLASLVDAVILREWLLSVGQRDALQKLCHLFCEMAVRLEAVGGMSDDGSFELPINQVTLADTLGLTSVHINRTLQRLRNEGLIRLCHRRLVILDRERLASIAGFDGAYLQVRLAAG